MRGFAISFIAFAFMLAGDQPSLAAPDRPGYRDGVLVVVDNYYAQQLKNDPLLAKHDKEYNAAWKKFIALFANETATKVRRLQWEIFKTRQQTLAVYISNPDQFRQAVVAFDTPQLTYMRLLYRLAQTPDVRLVMAVDPLRGRMGYIQAYPYSSAARPESLRSVYANLPQSENAFLPRQGSIYYNPEEDDDNVTEEDSRYRLSITKDAAARSEYITPHHASEEYRLIYRTPTQAWGYAKRIFEGRYSRELTTSIYSVINGRISFVPVALPKPTDFFLSGKIPWPFYSDGGEDVEQNIHPLDSQAGEDSGVMEKGLGKCAMTVTLTASDTPPHTVRAVLFQSNLDIYDAAWSCVPECSIPYVWQRDRLVPGKPDCLPAGKWGHFQPGPNILPYPEYP